MRRLSSESLSLQFNLHLSRYKIFPNLGDLASIAIPFRVEYDKPAERASFVASFFYVVGSLIFFLDVFFEVWSDRMLVGRYA